MLVARRCSPKIIIRRLWIIEARATNSRRPNPEMRDRLTQDLPAQEIAPRKPSIYLWSTVPKFRETELSLLIWPLRTWPLCREGSNSKVEIKVKTHMERSYQKVSMTSWITPSDTTLVQSEWTNFSRGRAIHLKIRLALSIKAARWTSSIPLMPKPYRVKTTILQAVTFRQLPNRSRSSASSSLKMRTKG